MIFKPILHPLILLAIFVLLLTGMAFITFKQPKNNRRKWYFRILIIFLLGVISYRPAVAGGVSQGGLTNLDITYVVDTTSSMAAEDFNGKKTRLSGVAKDIENLSKNFSGARFSLMYFESKAYLALPFTTDTNAVATQARTLNQEITYYSVGSSISTPLDLIKGQLKDGEENKPERSRMIIYFGDGEHTSSEAAKSFSEIKKSIDGGLVLGYGTSSGGRMKEFSGYDEVDEKDRYIKDYTSQEYPQPDAYSRIDEKNLQKIADEIGVKYYHRTENSDTASLVKSLNVEKLVKTTRDVKGSTDLYWILVIPIAVLLLLDFNRVYRLFEEVRGIKK